MSAVSSKRIESPQNGSPGVPSPSVLAMKQLTNDRTSESVRTYASGL